MMMLKRHALLRKGIITFAMFLLFVPVFFVHAEGGGMEKVLYNFVVNVFGALVGWGGGVLDFGVNTFVLDFGTQFRATGLGDMVDQVVRDFFNITFIFGLVYLGFTMILKNDDANTRRWLVSLIIAALLVNFSLFISKMVVDASNIIATQVINAGIDSGVFLPKADTEGSQIDFAASIMQQTKVVGALDRGTGNLT